MSETSQGPGWWLASDGRWYPPTTASGATQALTQQQSQYELDPFGYPVVAPASHKKKRSSRRSLVALLLVLLIVAAGAGGYEYWKHKNATSGTSFATGTPIGQGFFCTEVGNHREFLTWTSHDGAVSGFYQTTAGNDDLSGTQSGSTLSFEAGKTKATRFHLAGTIEGTTLHLTVPVGLTETSTICTLESSSKVDLKSSGLSTSTTSRPSTSTTSPTNGATSAKADLTGTLNIAKSIFATTGKLAFGTGVGTSRAQTPGTLQAEFRKKTPTTTFIGEKATPGAHSVGVWPVRSYAFVAVALDATGGCWVVSFNATPSQKATPTAGISPGTQFSWLTGKTLKNCSAQGAASEITNQASGSIPWTTSFAKITKKP